MEVGPGYGREDNMFLEHISHRIYFFVDEKSTFSDLLEKSERQREEKEPIFNVIK